MRWWQTQRGELRDDLLRLGIEWHSSPSLCMRMAKMVECIGLHNAVSYALERTGTGSTVA